MLGYIFLCGTTDAHSTGSTTSKKRGSKFHLHPVDTAEDVFKLKGILLSDCIPTLDDQHMSLQ